MSDITREQRAELLLMLLNELNKYRIDKILLRKFSGWNSADMDRAVKSLEQRGLICIEDARITIAASSSVIAESNSRALDVLENIKPELIQNTVFQYFKLAKQQDGLDTLYVLLSLCLDFAEKRSISALYVICAWLVEKLLEFKIAGSKVFVWQKYIDLCLAVHPLTLHFLQMGKNVVWMLYRARGASFCIGDFRSIALIDLMIGTEAIRHHTGRNAARLRSVAARGRSALAKLSEQDVQFRMAPYLGILDFLDGNYHNAIGNLSLRGRMTTSASLRVMDDIFVLYEAQAASLLGNFHLSNNILRATIRHATAQGGHTPPSILQVQLATNLLAQGQYQDALQLIDSAMNHISPSTDPVGWMCVCSVLAYYHRVNGRLEVSHGIMFRCMTWARDRVFPYFIYQTPYFLELLHDWEKAGLPSIPGFKYQNELQRSLEGPNQMLRTVALRLMGETCCREASPEMKANGISYMEQGLKLARGLDFVRERAKICVSLAKAYRDYGKQEEGLTYAMEAWSLKDMLRQELWLKELSDLIPAPLPVPASPQPLSAEALCDQVAQMLLQGKYETLEQCYDFILETICKIFGSARGCLLKHHQNTGRLIVLASQRITEEEIASKSFMHPASLVDDALNGAPVFTSLKIRNLNDEETVLVTCIPLVYKESEHAVLYLDGDIIPQVARALTPKALLDIGKLLAWELTRFHGHRQSPAYKLGTAINSSADDLYQLVYTGEKMADFLDKVDNAAQSDASVFIYGESGSGKELIARRIHAMSGRKGPFVAVNLSSLPDELFENEMLGHERGAFTGALQRKTGFFELANNGTLFIDELPDISHRIQIKLLRILQERSFSRLGSTQLVHSNFRLVVATNRNIKKAIQNKTFREDLYYRICVIQLEVPPLRQRKEDILPIMQHYIKYFAYRYGKPTSENMISPDDLIRIQEHAWPGNVRELKNVVEDAVIHWSGRRQYLKLQFDKTVLPADAVDPNPEDAILAPMPAADDRPDAKSFFAIPNPEIRHNASGQSMLEDYFSELPSLNEVKNQYIARVLEITDGKIDGRLGAANILGMTRSAVYYHLKKMSG